MAVVRVVPDLGGAVAGYVVDVGGYDYAFRATESGLVPFDPETEAEKGRPDYEIAQVLVEEYLVEQSDD